MCNKLFLKIKSVSHCGVTHGFVPCGTCYDCRSSMKNSWVFRLRAELSKLCENGWKIGFFTLTYSDKALPCIPYMLFDGKYGEVPCFDKDDVRDFFTKLKKWLARNYMAKKICDGKFTYDRAPRYICCAEYGEHTRRPHYHGIICVPPNVDMYSLHYKIKELWYHSESPDVPNLVPNQKGFVFPFDFNGGVDSHHYHHKSFVCDSVKAACVYAAKYVCKDLAYLDFIKDYSFRRSVSVYRHDIQVVNEPDVTFESDVFGDIVDCYFTDQWREKSIRVGETPLAVYKLSRFMPFHVQSKSLGASFLDGLSDAEKLRYLKEGYAFDGEPISQGLPVYLRNKIIFTPDYQIDEKTGKRLVRRKAKEFFRDNLQEIFSAKVDGIVEKIQEMQSLDFWKTVGAEKKDLEWIERNLAFRTTSARDLAASYLAFYGVRYDECYDINRALQWYRRFDENYVDVTDCPLLPYEEWCWYNYVFHGFFAIYNKYALALCEVKTVELRDNNFIVDYFKSRVCL